MTKKHQSSIEGIYGEMPKRPEHLSIKTESCDPNFAAGKATLKKQALIIDLGNGEATLSFTTIVPNTEEPCPAIINLGFESNLPNRFLPAEEIIDRGYGIFHLSIEDISENNANFKSGIASDIARSRRKKSAPGKLTVYAWAMARILESLINYKGIDKDNIILCGHGIAAVSALIAANYECKANFVIANDPFAAFGGLSKSQFASQMAHLFCPAYADEPIDDPIKELIANCKSKHILIGSATEKPFFDLDYESKITAAANQNSAGKLFYYARGGSEYFSRHDWNRYLDYIDSIAKNRRF